MTVTESTLTTAIIDTLRGGAQSLSAIAVVLGMLVRDLRTPVALLERDGALETRLDDREGREGRVRVFALSERFTLLEENRLSVIAQTGDQEVLDTLTVSELLCAADLVLPTRLKRKTRKPAIVAALLAAQCQLCETCGEEPVERSGQVCTVCEEAKGPAPTTPVQRRSTSSRRSRVARCPSVDLHDAGLTDAAITDAALIADSARSDRAAQRDLADWLIAANGIARVEVLRTLLREVGRLSAPNFTVNMKKDAFPRVERDGKLIGWSAR
jgi:hypothetical protein